MTMNDPNEQWRSIGSRMPPKDVLTLVAVPILLMSWSTFCFQQ